MIRTLIVAARDRARLAEILQVASRFGLGVLLARLGMEASADRAEGGVAGLDLPRRVRLALETLGPTFVKLGQILATRGDLFSPEWIAELEQLHSRAPTLPFEDLRADVEAALGEPPETAFALFDPQPLAAASMAQVHRAMLHDGRAVVLKIRRPGIRPRIEADLRLITQLAALAETASAEVRRFTPTAMVRQLAEAMLEELDFTAEGRNADRLRQDFEEEPRLVIPAIHWQWTSETLLVMDYVDGVPPRDGETLRAAGIDPMAIAELGADVVLDMILVNGRYHADPHPGNLLCLPGNRLALLDLGMIGHVTPRRQQEFIGFVQAISLGDAAALADTLALWNRGNGVPRERIIAAAERLIQRHGGGRVVLSELVADVFPLLRQEGMTMPPDLMLVFKAMVTVDGVLTAIQPGFDLSAAMRRSAQRVLTARFVPERWEPRMQALLWELAKLGDDAPRLIRAATRRLEAEPAGEGAVSAMLSRVGLWLVGAILGGAIIVAGTLLLH